MDVPLRVLMLLTSTVLPVSASSRTRNHQVSTMTKMRPRMKAEGYVVPGSAPMVGCDRGAVDAEGPAIRQQVRARPTDFSAGLPHCAIRSSPA